MLLTSLFIRFVLWSQSFIRWIQLLFQSHFSSYTFSFPQNWLSKAVSKPGLYPNLQITEPESKHQARYVSFPVWGGEGEEVKFVQAWWVQWGGLSHTRWRMKGQRWHSLAQEWKTFSSENREATSGRGSAERPWVSMHPFGEVTRLVYLVTEITLSRVWLEVNSAQSASIRKVECKCLACVLWDWGVAGYHQEPWASDWFELPSQESPWKKYCSRKMKNSSKSSNQTS